MLADKNIKEIFINILTDDKKVSNQYGCYSRQTHFKRNKFKNQIKIDTNNTGIKTPLPNSSCALNASTTTPPFT